ncbi:MAG: hypothetical protein H6739_10285 [Alphaproteobacteria bacterium]|nr:hypothetical protein [Alphaproteobacteria bacterium]
MLLRTKVFSLLASIGSFWQPDPPAPAPAPLPPAVAPETPQAICDGDEDCLARRWILVDHGRLGLPGLTGQRWVSYDYDEVTRSVPYEEFEGESELSLAVRLIISEVGADRLIFTAGGLREAIGILYSVDNRLAVDPAVGPVFPGCGPGGTFVTCANAVEYLGMDTWRAEDPSTRYRADMLIAAVDLAVVAWHLQEERLVADFTQGATSYVHRCGGTAYGLTTWHCDGTRRMGIRDVPGARPHEGPLVFKIPHWSETRRRWRMDEAHIIHYRPLGDRPGPALAAIDPLLSPWGMDGLVEAE